VQGLQPQRVRHPVQQAAPGTILRHTPHLIVASHLAGRAAAAAAPEQLQQLG
jgi:hypothetical protein